MLDAKRIDDLWWNALLTGVLIGLSAAVIIWQLAPQLPIEQLVPGNILGVRG
jgi:hypothetical protein